MKILLILAAVTLTELPNTKSSLVGYDCSEAELLATIRPEDIRHATGHATCNAIIPSAARSIRAEINEIKGTKIVVGYRCQVQYKQSLVDWRGTRRALPLGAVVIGRQACLNAHKSGNLDLELSIPYLQINGTTKHSIRTIYPDVRINQSHFVPGYHDQYYERDYEINLSQHLGLVDFEQNIVHFDNGIYCDFSNFSCVDDHIGELAWTSDLQQNVGFTSVFNGDITLVTVNETLTSPKKTYAVMQILYNLLSFEVLDNVTFGGRTMFRTKHPDLYIEPHTNSKILWSHYNILKLDEYVNFTHSYNSRYDSGVDIGKRIEHDEIAKRICFKDSLDFARMCNGSSEVLDYIGCIFPLPKLGMIGSITYLSGVDIKQCTEKSMFTRQTDGCFNAIAVRDDQYNEKFLNPVSRILVDRADPIACETKMLPRNPAFELDNQSSFFPDWLILIAVVFVGVWGLFGIIQLISLIKKRQYAISANKESTDELTSKRSYLQSFVNMCPTWKPRADVQEEAGYDVQFTS